MVNSDFLKVKSIPEISTTIVITSQDGSVKTLVVKEGDTVENLTYVDSGNLHTISGVVKVIKYTVAKDNSSVNSNCIHNTVSDFAKRVSISSLTVDCSDKYHSDIRYVPVSCIRDFIANGDNVIDISELRFSGDNVVSFMSNNVPVAAVWNGNVVEVIQNEGSEVYTFTAPTMLKTNVLVVMDSDTRVKTTVAGVTPLIVSDIDITANMSASVTNFIDKYFNKYTDTDRDIEVERDDVYVKVASGVTDAEVVVINGDTFTKGNEIPVGIGQNSYVNICPFLIENDDLYLASPVAKIAADELDNVVVEVNGFTLEFKIIDNTIDTKLSIASIEAVGHPENGYNVVEMEDGVENIIVQTRTTGLGKVRVELLDAESTPVPEGLVTYVKTSNELGEVISYEVCQTGVDGTIDLTASYYNDDVIESTEIERTFDIAVGDAETISIKLFVEEIVPIDPPTEDGDDTTEQPVPPVVEDVEPPVDTPTEDDDEVVDDEVITDPETEAPNTI